DLCHGNGGIDTNGPTRQFGFSFGILFGFARGQRLIFAGDSALPMKSSFPWLFLAGLASAGCVCAQDVFLAAYGNEPPNMAKGVSLDRLLVDAGGKTQVITANSFSFGHALFYRPGLVTLSNFRIQNRHLVMQKSGANLNYELRIFGDATSDVELKDCFLVLEI